MTKRFYANAAVRRDAATGLWSIELDGRGVKTPARAPLSVQTEALADAIAAEWNAQVEKIDPASMPMTGFANATIDRVLPDVPGFVATIAAYAESDLLCYRADDEAELAALQATAWDVLLGWARNRYDITFALAGGIMPVNQPPATIARLRAAVAALDPWQMAGVSTIVSLSGSLIGTLALIEGATNADAIWRAAHVDEHWQRQQWGADPSAVAREEERRADFDRAVRFCALAKGD